LSGSDVSDTTQDAMLGSSVGPYRLLRKLGQGGMGSVYEGIHDQLGRRVAVKLLLSEMLSSQGAADRFFNEAHAVSAVTHPSLVAIYEHGRSSDGQPYIAMELLDGQSLREQHEQRYLGGSALLIMQQVAQALAETHKRRIVHRDRS
jgi:serine/threonine-protein kinase